MGWAKWVRMKDGSNEKEDDGFCLGFTYGYWNVYRYMKTMAEAQLWGGIN